MYGTIIGLIKGVLGVSTIAHVSLPLWRLLASHYKTSGHGHYGQRYGWAADTPATPTTHQAMRLGLGQATPTTPPHHTTPPLLKAPPPETTINNYKYNTHYQLSPSSEGLEERRTASVWTSDCGIRPRDLGYL